MWEFLSWTIFTVFCCFKLLTSKPSDGLHFWRRTANLIIWTITFLALSLEILPKWIFTDQLSGHCLLVGSAFVQFKTYLHKAHRVYVSWHTVLQSLGCQSCDFIPMVFNDALNQIILLHVPPTYSWVKHTHTHRALLHTYKQTYWVIFEASGSIL